MLNRLLRLIVDHNIADYMTAKNNVMISYKVGVQQSRPQEQARVLPLAHHVYRIILNIYLLCNRTDSLKAGVVLFLPSHP